MAVISILDHGAVGDGVTSDKTAFTDAIAAASPGDRLLIPTPPVHWLIQDVVIDKSLEVVGEGWLPEIRRLQGQSRDVFDVQADRVSFENVSIDCRADQNFSTCIKGQGLTSVYVRRCQLYSTLVPTDGWTIHATSLVGCNDLLIENNRMDWTQLKLGGAGGANNGPGIRVIGNYGTNCRNFGTSIVNVNALYTVEDVIVVGNHFLGCWSGGVYIGSDGDNRETLRVNRLVVANNIVTVASDDIGRGVLIRGGKTAGDWVVANNALSGTSTERLSQGVLVKKGDNGHDDFGRLVIAGNAIRHAASQGIAIRTRVGEAVVVGNVCKDSAVALELVCADATSGTAEMLDVTVGDNVFHGAHAPVSLTARHSGLLRVRMGNNRIDGTIDEVTETGGTVDLCVLEKKAP